jgi:hypothetical protein
MCQPLDSHRVIDFSCLNSPFQGIVRGVGIRLEVHHISDIIQALQNKLTCCRTSKHGNTSYSVMLDQWK